MKIQVFKVNFNNIYCALSALMLSSQDDSPQNGDNNIFFSFR